EAIIRAASTSIQQGISSTRAIKEAMRSPLSASIRLRATSLSTANTLRWAPRPSSSFSNFPFRVIVDSEQLDRNPLTRPAPAEENAGGGPPSPPRGRGAEALRGYGTSFVGGAYMEVMR